MGQEVNFNFLSYDVYIVHVKDYFGYWFALIITLYLGFFLLFSNTLISNELVMLKLADIF